MGKMQCNRIDRIMNVMSKELMTGIAYASNSRRVRENLREKIDKENSVRTFHLHKEITFLTQGTTIVSTHFSRLSDLWDEFDTLILPPTSSSETSKAFVEHIQKHRIF
ncbi:hypothetical protein KY290_007932 [Solanum tuberosum]|uniref:Uncharacterized protein n=1 Tax=Solanum tuberosum TaxID=4113 RepID=A0ABQ7W8A4_SOLTU|nr:hypothetical protein KY290_007932 [Solanum tuberosum]